ncbi:MAG: hypothetical protein JRN10_05055 [Nitrososphaerota archaeon]|jgi:uncharacterized protein YgbK (DUF1537 family)|nr:hypothetical protein [Nitrososphaerota archaeon]MDG6930589.1 hypothetical protein [Nitrososphaerota archaeon]
MRFVIFSDDFTGTNGVASMMAHYCDTANINLTTMLNNKSLMSDFQCITVNTNTRNLDGRQSSEIIKQAYSEIINRGSFFVKRIDSTLRGNIEPEALALKGDKKFIITDTIPEYSRYTKNGYTVTDSSNKISIISLFRTLKGKAYTVEQINELDKSLDFFVIDSYDYGDLENIAQAAIDNNFIPMDPGPLCSIYGKKIVNQQKRSTAGKPKINSVVFVVGTTEEITINQVKYSALHGFTLLKLKNYSQAKLKSDNIIMFDFLKDRFDMDRKFVKFLSAYDAIVISGGDTANLIFEMGEGEFIENMPGNYPLIGIGKIKGGILNNKIMITKGGRIGTEDVLIRIKNQLLGGGSI